MGNLRSPEVGYSKLLFADQTEPHMIIIIDENFRKADFS